ncbi:MAG: glycosyltransferase [Planctomycetes bacterium]|nr:glycosyltransferase [Planctomycetota bacterium]
MKVMLLVTDLERGGTPGRIARLARGLHAESVEVHVGCLAAAGPVSADLEREGIATFACYATGPRDLSVLARLSGHVRRIRPKLIHSTLTHANLAARLMGLRHRIPVIGSTATIEVERRWHLTAERWTARLDRRHVVNSRAVAEHVRTAFRLPASRIDIVPPSVDPPVTPVDRDAARRALDLAEHEFVVLWAGRFDPVKRLEIVVRCAEIMSDIPSRFLLAGDGAIRDEIERCIRLSSAASRVALLGWRDDLPTLMAAADAFIFPSLTEGMPNAVLEAMAAGLPIVAADIPALRELAGDDQRMALVDSDQPVAYADALRQLAADPKLRENLGRRASEWAREHLDPAVAVKAVIQIYRKLLRSSD